MPRAIVWAMNLKSYGRRRPLSRQPVVQRTARGQLRTNLTKGSTMNETLDGKWSYRSFRHEPIVLKDGQVQGNPELATPWSPPGGVLEVTTGELGEVMGALTFAPGGSPEGMGKDHSRYR